MSIINPQTKEINCKIVYYGPALSGKTTSMLALQNKVKSDKKSLTQEVSVKERTLFFDFLALSSRENVKSYKVKFQVYTVPGQVLYEDSRKLLLNGVDGIIFVADSRLEYLEDSMRSMNELELNLTKLGYDPSDIPTVIQYNKRDSATAARLEDLSEAINSRKLPEFETVAMKGQGVFESFETIVQKIIMELKEAA
jgi:signal recognition particle receptor subunit beta